MGKADFNSTATELKVYASDLRDELQETLDDLGDKQGEHENEARGEKIDKLAAAIDALEDLDSHIDEAVEAVREV